MFLEIVSPLFPNYFLLLVCTGSLAKALVGVAGGATRATITQHQAIRNNMAGKFNFSLHSNSFKS